jgi:hypothetical protein
MELSYGNNYLHYLYRFFDKKGLILNHYICSQIAFIELPKHHKLFDYKQLKKTCYL